MESIFSEQDYKKKGEVTYQGFTDFFPKGLVI